MKLLIVVDIHRDHHHHRCGGNPYQKGEVRDIYPPRNFVAHSRHHQTVDELAGVGVETQQAQCREDPHPRVVAPVADEGDAHTTRQEYKVVSNRRPHTSK